MKQDNNSSRNKHIDLLIRFKRQSIIVKIFILLTILILAVIVVLNFLTLALGQWKNIGYYSIWVLFAWLFLGVFIYIISKLISVSVFKHQNDRARLEQQRIAQQKVDSIKQEVEKIGSGEEDV